jgi:hypothetical protein
VWGKHHTYRRGSWCSWAGSQSYFASIQSWGAPQRGIAHLMDDAGAGLPEAHSVFGSCGRKEVVYFLVGAHRELQVSLATEAALPAAMRGGIDVRCVCCMHFPWRFEAMSYLSG